MEVFHVCRRFPEFFVPRTGLAPLPKKARVKPEAAGEHRTGEDFSTTQWGGPCFFREGGYVRGKGRRTQENGGFEHHTGVETKSRAASAYL